MTITVYGAGAIGGVTGAALARAGHDVLLVDRADDHVTAMNAHGLTIESREGSATIPVRAIAPGALGRELGLVLLAVKSQDTPAALEILAPRLAADGGRRVSQAAQHVLVVLKQIGVDCPDLQPLARGNLLERVPIVDAIPWNVDSDRRTNPFLEQLVFEFA